MKLTKKYYFSVEGETEKWYLDWLENTINNEERAKNKVSINSKVQKNPLKYAKSLSLISKIQITHLYDYESNDEVHTNQFREMLDCLKDTKKLGKQIKYDLGYSNFTFELWMILHKTNCNTSFADRAQYIKPINKAYDENFLNLHHYKHEANFKRVLKKIGLCDVITAVNRAKSIMQSNQLNGLVLHEYKGYKYYKENPSLSIYESIEKILKDCKLM